MSIENISYNMPKGITRPNPTQNFVYITVNNLEQVTVLNTEGKIVLKTIQNRIGIEELNAGMYMLKIETHDKPTQYSELIKR